MTLSGGLTTPEIGVSEAIYSAHSLRRLKSDATSAILTPVIDLDPDEKMARIPAPEPTRSCGDMEGVGWASRAADGPEGTHAEGAHYHRHDRAHQSPSGVTVTVYSTSLVITVIP